MLFILIILYWKLTTYRSMLFSDSENTWNSIDIQMGRFWRQDGKKGASNLGSCFPQPNRLSIGNLFGCKQISNTQPVWLRKTWHAVMNYNDHSQHELLSHNTRWPQDIEMTRYGDVVLGPYRTVSPKSPIKSESRWFQWIGLCNLKAFRSATSFLCQIVQRSTSTLPRPVSVSWVAWGMPTNSRRFRPLQGLQCFMHADVGF